MTSSTELTIARWRTFPQAQKLEAFKGLPPGFDDEIFLSLTAREHSELVLALPEPERRLWVPLLAPDDAADLIQASPGDQRESMVRYLDGSTMREVTALLAYAEDDAGGLMSTRFAPHS